MSVLPKARSHNLLIQKISKELLVYDLETNKAFCLNETCSVVYQFCDGRTELAELGYNSNLSEEVVVLAINELRNYNLLEKGEFFNLPFNKKTRREIVRKIGLSSIFVIPVIATIVAPVAAAAQSTCINPGGVADGQYLSTNSTSGTCSSHSDDYFNEFCHNPVHTGRCCSNTAHYNDCTTVPGSPPFSSFTCYCGP